MLTSQMKRFVRRYYDGIGTPLSRACKTAFNEEKWNDLVTMTVNPKDYTTAWELALDLSAVSLLRKCRDLPVPVDRTAVAKRLWFDGEASCLKTNIRLDPYLEGFSHPLCDPAILHHLDGVRKIIKTVLGRAPSRDDLIGKFGPGATFSDRAARSTAADKMNNPVSLTLGALWFLPPWLETAWGRANARSLPPRNPVIVRGNRFATAPKDALKDRAIAAEPSLNIFYQLSLGKLIRRHLVNRAGIDLTNGQEIHRQLACEASITGSLATLDLTNASDTVARNLVKLLLPPDWFELLDELRSPMTKINGVWVKLEKFSSMGNGYTFELETLIFYAITHYAQMVVSNADVITTKVYGDDIICQTECVDAVVKILNFCGFTLNAKKSFASGDFRESCGGDYFKGQAVRPYFMEEIPCEPQEFVAAANALRSKALDSFGGFDIHRSAWYALLDQIPANIRCCRGPKSLGDIVIADDWEEWSKLIRQRSQTGYIRCLRPHRFRKVPYRLFDDDVVHACALYGFPWSGGGIMPRDSIESYKVGWIPFYGTRWLPGPSKD